MKYQPVYIIILLCLCSACSEQSGTPPPSQEEKPDTVQTPRKEPTTSKSFLDTQEESSTDYSSKYINTPPEDESIIQFGQNQLKKPASWIWIPPRSIFTLSNYVLPGIQGEESGMFTISEFDIEEGGGFDMNVLRWKDHFRNNEGAPIKPVISIIDINGRDSQMVHLKGEYMGAGAAWHKPGYTLLVVLYEDDTKRYFFKLLGPTETISAHRDSFYESLLSLEVDSSF